MRFNLLQALRTHWEQLPHDRREGLHFHHICTDEAEQSRDDCLRRHEPDPRMTLILEPRSQQHPRLAKQAKAGVSGRAGQHA